MRVLPWDIFRTNEHTITIPVNGFQLMRRCLLQILRWSGNLTCAGGLLYYLTAPSRDSLQSLRRLYSQRLSNSFTHERCLPHHAWAKNRTWSPSKLIWKAAVIKMPCAVGRAFRCQLPMAQDASAGNQTCVTSMATMYSTTRPLMLLTLKLCFRRVGPRRLHLSDHSCLTNATSSGLVFFSAIASHPSTKPV